METPQEEKKLFSPEIEDIEKFIEGIEETARAGEFEKKVPPETFAEAAVEVLMKEWLITKPEEKNRVRRAELKNAIMEEVKDAKSLPAMNEIFRDIKGELETEYKPF